MGGNMMKKRAALYTRVSSKPQGEGYSLASQIDECRRYAAQQGYAVVGEFRDMHTGEELNRPELNRLRRLMEDGGTDCVIVYDLDRLSRRLVYYLFLEEEATRCGVQVEYVRGQYDATPEGQLRKNFDGIMAEYENTKRVERSRRGKEKRVRSAQVFMPTSRSPYGYVYVSEPHKGRLEICEEEAAVVRLIFEWAAYENIGSYTIARRLWERGIPSKADVSTVVTKKGDYADWAGSTVRKILMNPVYKGLWCYGKTRRVKVNGKTLQRAAPRNEWIEVPVPAIIDVDTWERAQVRLAHNKQESIRNTKRQYLLQGHVFCRCGRRMAAECKNGTTTRRYYCRNHDEEGWRGRCSMRRSFRADDLEEAVWNEVRCSFLDPDNLRALIEDYRREARTQGNNVAARLEQTKATLAEVDRKLGLLLDDLLSGGFPRAIIEQRREGMLRQRADLLVEIQRTEAELRTATITPDVEAELLSFARRVSTALDEVGYEEKRHMLNLLNVRVDVHDFGRVTLSGCLQPGRFVDTLSA
jgi:site-specific DNA recombinase